ncbi:hypothetical protein, partial [Pectobacterium brasiliense]|uniref:hypothetical protein n=1 Tax=Pectobacterium brasiliense TaxID=180957 RepID=UPI0019698262
KKQKTKTQKKKKTKKTTKKKKKKKKKNPPPFKPIKPAFNNTSVKHKHTNFLNNPAKNPTKTPNTNKKKNT